MKTAIAILLTLGAMNSFADSEFILDCPAGIKNKFATSVFFDNTTGKLSVVNTQNYFGEELLLFGKVEYYENISSPQIAFVDMESPGRAYARIDLLGAQDSNVPLFEYLQGNTQDPEDEELVRYNLARCEKAEGFDRFVKAMKNIPVKTWDSFEDYHYSSLALSCVPNDLEYEYYSSHRYRVFVPIAGAYDRKVKVILESYHGTSSESVSDFFHMKNEVTILGQRIYSEEGPTPVVWTSDNRAFSFDYFSGYDHDTEFPHTGLFPEINIPTYRGIKFKCKERWAFKEFLGM